MIKAISLYKIEKKMNSCKLLSKLGVYRAKKPPICIGGWWVLA